MIVATRRLAAWWRRSSEYGILIALVLLCVFFSIVTYDVQNPTGAAAGRQLAAAIDRDYQQPRVLIVAEAQRDGVAFAEALREGLSSSGVDVASVVTGSPRDARQALVAVRDGGGTIQVVAATQTASKWFVFSNLADDFPTLGPIDVVTPTPYSWPNFLKSSNLLNIANQIAVIAIVAVGMTMVIITGGIDLSVGSLIALASVVTTLIIRDYGGALEATPVAMLGASVAGVLVCGLVGGFSGWMITQFAIPPFIVTLAMMLVASGAAYLLAESQSVYQIPQSFVWLGRGADVMSIPNAVLLTIILYLAAHVLMTRTRLGRYIYAVGGNREAARLSGIRTKWVLMFAYVSSGLLAGLGGVVMASQLKSGAPTYGVMYELLVIAAVVVGGTSLSGGSGSIAGTLVGALVIAVIRNGMNLTGVESNTQKVVLGLVILAAVLLDRLKHAGETT